MSDYLQPHGQWPTRLLCPRDFPGKHSEECSNFLLRGSSRPRDQTFVSSLAGRFFTTEPPGKPTYQDCCSVTQSYLTVWDPMVCSMPGFPVLQYFPELLKLMSIKSVMPSKPSHPLPSPSPPALNLSQHQDLFQWVSSSHLVAKVLSFSFNLSPSNEYSGLISFRIDWFDLLAVQGTLKNLLQHHSSKASIFQRSVLWSNSHIQTWLWEHSYIKLNNYHHDSCRLLLTKTDIQKRTTNIDDQRTKDQNTDSNLSEFL